MSTATGTRRRIYRSYGKRLVDAGVLADRDQIFMLGTPEIEAALAGELPHAEAQRRVTVRRVVWEKTLPRAGAEVP